MQIWKAKVVFWKNWVFCVCVFFFCLRVLVFFFNVFLYEVFGCISFNVVVFVLWLVLKLAGIQGRKDLQSGSLLSTCQCRMIK